MATNPPEFPVDARRSGKHEATERYIALSRLTKSIRSGKNFLDVIARDMRALVQFEIVGYVDEDTRRLDWRHGDGLEIPADDTAMLRVLQAGRDDVIRNVSVKSDDPEMAAILQKWGLESACALVLATPNRRFGSLFLGSTRPNTYSDELQFLRLAASEFAHALEDCINYHASQRFQKRLRLLLYLTNRFVSNLDLQDVLREASTGVRRLLECDAAGVNLPIPGEGRMRIYALDLPDAKGALQEELVLPLDDSPLIREVLTAGKPVYASGEEYSAKGRRGVAEGLRCGLFIPMITRGAVLGVLTIGRKEERAFSDEDVEFVTNVAGQMAIAVENAQAYRRISDLNARLAEEKLYLEDEIRSEMNFDEIVGQSTVLRHLLHQVEIVAPTDSTVLIHGKRAPAKSWLHAPCTISACGRRRHL